MKIKQFKQLFLFFTLLGTMFISCQKDAIIEPTDAVASNTNIINAAYEANLSTIFSNYGTISNNILDFNSVQSFYAFKEIVQSMNENENTSGIEDAYFELGFSEEDLSDDSDENIPANPILDLFENNLGFVSARQKEETDLFTFLDNGGDPVDFEDHFVFDLYFQTLLNDHNEIKVGTRIYRVLNEQLTLVSENNMPTFIASRDFQNIESEYYARIRVNETQKYEELFLTDSEGNRIGYQEYVDLTYNFHSIGDTYSMNFQNTSFVDFGYEFTPEFTWTFSNGFTYTGHEPPTIDFNESDFPLTMQLEVSTPSGAPITVTRVIPVNKRACENYIPNPFKVEGDKLILSPFANIPYDCDVYFTFDGGSVIHTSWGRTKSLTLPNGTDCFRVDMWVDCDGVRCHYIFQTCPVPVTCNIKRQITGIAPGSTQSHYWRLKGHLWCGVYVFGGGRIGASSKSYRKKKNKNKWRYRSCDKICADVVGISYQKENDGSCTEIGHGINPSCRHGKLVIQTSGNLNKNPRVKSGETRSNHRLKEDNLIISLSLTL